ncbi:MAG: WD40/YVTN/BNR-like repeat-containing protein, partial [Novipirellula sp. JB048]
ADGAVYAGTEPSKLFVSRDAGRSWRELTALQDIPSRPTWSFPPRPWTSHVRSIAPHPQDARLLLAGIELGGVMRSEDGGESWSDHPPGAQKDVHTLAWHPSAAGHAYEAGGGGAAWTHDGGRSWQPADEGRDRHYTWALAVDPDDPECWYVSASPNARSAHHSDNRAEAYLYRWRGGGPWQPLAGGLPQPLDHFPYVLAIDSSSLFAGLGDGRIYQSEDRGEHWSPLSIHGEAPSRVVALIPLNETPS